jgi:lysine decarboxylase
VVVHSPHKTLGSLTQSSLLHLRSGRVDAERVDALLQMLQSSSPSALLLVSLELALEEMALDGRRRWGGCLDLAARARAELATAGVNCYGDEMLGRSGIAAYDPTKLVIDIADRRMTAPEAALWLAEARAIRPEFTDLRRLVFSLTIADDDASANELVASLVALAAEAPVAPADTRLAAVWPHTVPARALTVREALMGAGRATQELPLGAALGAVSAEMVVPYPPGIPLLVPGEIVDDAVVATIAQLRAQGVRIVGMAAPTTLRCLRR